MRLLLKQGRLIDPVPQRDEVLDILIVDGVIEKMGTIAGTGSDAEQLDLKGKIVAPGFMDMHVHFREPGYEQKETIETGCQAARAGGFTAVCCMPNTNPAIDNEEVVHFVQRKGESAADGLVDVYVAGAVTKGREGKELAPMAELVDAGVVAFTDDGNAVESAEIMRRALEYAMMFNLPVIQHCEDRTLTRDGVMNEGLFSTILGMPMMPSIAEDIIVMRDIFLAEYVSARYHIAHISTAGAIELVRQAKRKAISRQMVGSITCEVTPHHFTLTDEAVRSFDTNTKMNPPLRTAKDVQAVKEGLRDGTIDVIATDHAPHAIEEKEVEYVNAPFGIVGLETAIGLTMTELVTTGVLTTNQMVEKMSANPRRILNLPQIKIEVGQKANLTLIDPNLEWIVDIGAFHSKSKNSPFHGWKLKGKAIGAINKGKTHIAR